MKLIYLSLLLSLFIQTTNAVIPNSNCTTLKNKVDRVCNQDQMRASCDNLKLCQDLRTNCPQPKDSVAGCTDFASCLEEKATAENTSYFCGYSWTGQPNDGVCYLKNQRTDSFSYRCPGYKNRFDEYRDANFTCEGHRQRATADSSKCISAVNDLKLYCSSTSPGVPASLLNCVESTSPLTVVDSEIAPAQSQDGSRNIGIAPPKESLTLTNGRNISAPSLNR